MQLLQKDFKKPCHAYFIEGAWHLTGTKNNWGNYSTHPGSSGIDATDGMFISTVMTK